MTRFIFRLLLRKVTHHYFCDKRQQTSWMETLKWVTHICCIIVMLSIKFIDHYASFPFSTVSLFLFWPCTRYFRQLVWCQTPFNIRRKKTRWKRISQRAWRKNRSRKRESNGKKYFLTTEVLMILTATECRYRFGGTFVLKGTEYDFKAVNLHSDSETVNSHLLGSVL